MGWTEEEEEEEREVLEEDAPVAGMGTPGLDLGKRAKLYSRSVERKLQTLSSNQYSLLKYLDLDGLGTHALPN